MIKNKLFRECLDSIPKDRMAEFELNFSIAERIAEILKQKGMTQRDLANKLGKRESEISKWLTGRHNFTISTLSKISYILDSPIILVANKPYPITEENCLMAAEEQAKYELFEK
ncbi:MAG: helix-turn-helix domain-containing protein [Bacteroidales bacterium]|nr:helix-turn-helix domain-containing protein [Bacteroidales bacterium]